MKFKHPFCGVPAGKIYPRTYEAGEDCPAEFEASARAQGCLDDKPAKGAKAAKTGD
ncbi:MAG: hypothetical protein J2O44_06175 [Porphyrobacter sp.]|nr:hypothetical protein [Porphyrobacter sp.]